MIRTFIALELPASIRMHLSLLIGGVPGAKWVKEQNYHITLRFLGELDRLTLEDVDAALQNISAPGFELMLGGVGQFGGERTHALWVGVERAPGLLHLRDKVESALVRAGIPHERRKFSPHITLARLRNTPSDRVSRFLSDHSLFKAGPIRIDRFILYASYTGGEASVYEPLQEYALKAL